MKDKSVTIIVILVTLNILTISFNMFAAEVEFHAEAVYDWKSSKLPNLPILGSWYERAIIADIAFGEEVESGIFDQYYDPENFRVKRQESIHGKY